jgi:outer membrane protein assembly factor BamB
MRRGPAGRPGRTRSAALTAVALALLSGTATAQTFAITTHHVDTGRTGWNKQETVLTPVSMAAGGFGQVATVPLDEQVDGQPLYVAGQAIVGKGVRNVIYVGTENNTVYAIDAGSGQILLSRTLGPPVPMSVLPGQCNNNSTSIGITSTPVIDPASKTIYVITYTFESGTPVYRLHALDLGSLQEKMSTRYINTLGTLSDGSTYHFNASASRQRSALLLSNGTIYAGFASFCDNNPSVSRGWVLGWQAATLLPLAKNLLEDSLKTSPQTFFLSSIWMSGMGIAADPAGSVYFITGNSDPTSAAPVALDMSESVLKFSPDLGTLQSSFTPGNPTSGFAVMEQMDHDFSAGGITLLPTQPGAFPNLAVAAGKAGPMYLLNRDSLGGYQSGADNVLAAQSIGNRCWCGESYFQGADGVGRIVSSADNIATIWRLNTSSVAKPSLVKESSTPALASGQDSGFFTSISSNGTVAKTQIVWAVARPVTTSPGTVTLYAFDPSTVQAGQAAQIYSGSAGVWPSPGNANIVPLVAAGRVYVASYKQLAIFGLGAPHVPTLAARIAAAPRGQGQPGHGLWGTVASFEKTTVVLKLRTGRAVTADVSAVAGKLALIRFQPGSKVLVHGEYDASGTFRAISVVRAKDSTDLWGRDY